MKNYKLSAFISFYVLASSLFLGLTTYAQSADNLGLSVSPQIFELDVFPGEIIKNKIILKNLSAVPLPILVKSTDFTAEDVSGEMEFDESLQDPSISSSKWFNFEKPNFILPARQNSDGESGDAEGKQNVNFNISVPENAEPGGHYSVVLFEPQLPSYYFKPGQPKVVPVVGVLFLISVRTLSLEPVLEEVGPPLEIAEFKIPKEEKINILEKLLAGLLPAVSAAEINILEKNPASFLLRIKNNDLYHHKLAGTISIYNFFGKKVGETGITRTTILPGKIRQFPVNVSSEIPKILAWMPASIANFIIQNSSFGKYTAVLEIGEEQNKNIELNQTINFWAFPWKILLPLLFTLTILILLRKRIILAIKILIHSKPSFKT